MRRLATDFLCHALQADTCDWTNLWAAAELTSFDMLLQHAALTGHQMYICGTAGHANLSYTH